VDGGLAAVPEPGEVADPPLTAVSDELDDEALSERIGSRE
jgi:hypothetical protein